jgi:hypothetical protein
MPDVDPHDVEKAIKAIQNIAIMLTGAAEFVCEKRMLKRFSGEIEDNLDRLENDIASLKEQFTGKLPETLQPDSYRVKRHCERYLGYCWWQGFRIHFC